MQALRKLNPSAVTVANQVTRKRTTGRNTRTKPHLGVPWKLWELSLMKNYLCATLHNKMPYITQDVEAAYYCVPIIV
jgi:hypothetical protein